MLRKLSAQMGPIGRVLEFGSARSMREITRERFTDIRMLNLAHRDRDPYNWQAVSRKPQ